MDRIKLAPYAGREQAFVKHLLLERYLERLVMITGQGRYSRIAYVDAFAGPWKATLDDLSDTSFARAVQVMEDCRVHLATKFGRSVTFRALFVERDAERYTRLKKFADERSTDEVQIEAINEDFAESSASVANWIRDNEMAFVLVDPTGWKDAITPTTLRPLLQKSNVELLINVMWNFINLASGHASQERNLRDLVGDEYSRLLSEGSINDGENWMRAYLRRLRDAVPAISSRQQLRTAWFPVEFATKDRVFYYLAYVTHHVKGVIVFLEESERANSQQQRVKFVVKQKSRELRSGMSDIFGDEMLSLPTKTDDKRIQQARNVWLQLLRNPGNQIKVDESCIASMAEECGCLISELQNSLRALIADGTLENMDAIRLRPKNVVDYHKGEQIRRLK